VHLLDNAAFRHSNTAWYYVASLLDPGPIATKVLENVPVAGQRASTEPLLRGMSGERIPGVWHGYNSYDGSHDSGSQGDAAGLPGHGEHGGLGGGAGR